MHRRAPRRTLATAVAAIATLALAGPAAGALPTKGAVYKGTVGGNEVKVKISKTSRTKGKFTYDCGANGGPLGEWIKLKIDKKGRFDGGTKFGGADVYIDRLKGRFRTRRRATATFTLSICNGEGGRLTLRRAKQG